MEDITEKIEMLKNKELEEQKEYYANMGDDMVEERVEFVDLYNQGASKIRAESKKTRPNGSSPMVLAVTQSIINGDGMPGLAKAYDRAEDTVGALKAKGEPGRADLMKQQYMEEHFIPAVETVIRYSSPDELLNCKEALDALDKCALGVGKMNGYTASYIRQAYGDLLGKDLDGRFNKSDDAVKNAVFQIKVASANGNIRNAVGIAVRIKESIDNGKFLASDDDYDLIGRVAAYGS